MPLQSLNLRAALFRCLNELKKNGILGKDVMVRKTFFDDCKGERIQDLLISFSTLVLRKVLTAGHGGRACIAARLATAKTVTPKEQKSFLPLAVAHRVSLTALLNKKKESREKYKNFGRTLDAKEQELDRRFEAVVSNQDLLDKNVIPDHTVARVSKLFEQNWQGDRKPVEVIAQGEEQGMKDSLLDRPFSETWQQITNGTFEGATGTSWQGLLQDLEERVATQEARLTDWRNFSDAMRRDEKTLSAVDNTSSTSMRTQSKDPTNQKQRDFGFSTRKSPRKSPGKSDWKMNETSPTHPKRPREEITQLKERDLVFSPRKSPRKSMWPVEEPGAEPSPAHSGANLKQKETEIMASRNGDLDSMTESRVRVPLIETQESETAVGSSHGFSMDDTDESGFSEISDGQFRSEEPPEHTEHIDRLIPTQHSNQDEVSSASNNEKSEPQNMQSRSSEILRPSGHSNKLFTEDRNPAISDDDDSWIPSLPGEGKQEDKPESQSRNEDDLIAEQIVSMTINAVPTPAKSEASLMERTRQSMAFASPVRLHGLLPEGPSLTPLPPRPSKTSHKSADTSGPATLLERTRKSISLVSSKPKGSCKSMLDRRASKIYPTNQFETPRKQLERVTELTPPEELFSPGAGYDSVFKSRPKIALSPNPSPRAVEESETDDVQGERGGDGRIRNRQREASPLARMTANV